MLKTVASGAGLLQIPEAARHSRSRWCNKQTEKRRNPVHVRRGAARRESSDPTVSGGPRPYARGTRLLKQPIPRASGQVQKWSTQPTHARLALVQSGRMAWVHLQHGSETASFARFELNPDAHNIQFGPSSTVVLFIWRIAAGCCFCVWCHAMHQCQCQCQCHGAHAHPQMYRMAGRVLHWYYQCSTKDETAKTRKYHLTPP